MTIAFLILALMFFGLWLYLLNRLEHVKDELNLAKLFENYYKDLEQRYDELVKASEARVEAAKKATIIIDKEYTIETPLDLNPVIIPDDKLCDIRPDFPGCEAPNNVRGTTKDKP